MQRALALLFALFFGPSLAHADSRTGFRLEANGGMVVYKGKTIDATVTRFRLMPELVHRSRRGLIFHIGPTVGVARAAITVRRRITRTLSTAGLKNRITEATAKVPQSITIPTSGLGPYAAFLLPPTITIPLLELPDLGEHIPDSIRLSLPYTAEIDVPWTPILGFRTSLELLANTRFRLEPYVEYEHTLGAVSGKVRSLTVDTGTIGLDLGFMRNQFSVTDTVSFLTAGFRIGYMADRWRPYVDLGLVSVRNTYDVSARGGFKRTLDSAGVKANKRDDHRLLAPFYVLGTEIDVSDSVFLRAEAAVAGYKKRTTTYFNGGIGFRLGN